MLAGLIIFGEEWVDAWGAPLALGIIPLTGGDDLREVGDAGEVVEGAGEKG